MQNVLILTSSLLIAALLLYPRLSRAPLWRATMTPLASIIGSGFLVLGPILHQSWGASAPLVMAALCAGAWAFGAAIRSNIAHRSTEPRPMIEQKLETAASWVLSFAYVISVAYYLNLFGAFGVSLTSYDDALHAQLLTSAMFLLILGVGWLRGFDALERLEQVTVGVKLVVIAGLLAGLAGYFVTQTQAGALQIIPPQVSLWQSLTLGFGLIVTVQGFETSRYLSESYDARVRIRSMQWAQTISTVIYMIYITLLAYAFAPATGVLSETAIIAMMAVVAPILPAMLVGAALSAQFSAAIADTSGAGGLIAELTRSRVSSRQAYAVLVGAGLALTWSADVFQIIAYASRAFALYYALQAAIAASHRDQSALRVTAYAGLAVFGLAIAVLGTPIE
ncbi:hypothetical protein [Cypionkella sp.]|uniref:hypothetical protein n=1 Tax=Cypionkella sp. TaxID=2811411 RepID=UPI003750D446